jgi:ABC-type Fe3+/spermidine/putrescine transport system ATPase subunit
LIEFLAFNAWQIDMTTVVSLENVTKSFGTVQVIKGISLAIEKGEFVSLLGPSGCGKTTLLRMIAGLESTTSGRIVIGGADATALPPERRDIAMVFQSYALLPHLSVRENILFPLQMRRIGNRSEQQDRAQQVLKMVQMDHLADRKPRELSGGQQQRVAIARAVVSEPQVLLLDEPLSNLDAKLRENMQEELIKLHMQTGLTTIFVTHDQEEALSLSDRVILLNKGDIEQEGTPSEIYNQPRTRFAASFMGSGNLIDADIECSGPNAFALIGDQRLPLGQRELNDGDRVTLMLRQEAIRLSPDINAQDVTATVETRVFLGARTRYVLNLGGQSIRCLGDADLMHGEHQRLSLEISPSSVIVMAKH